MQLESVEHNLRVRYKEDLTEQAVKVKRLEADLEAMRLKENQKLN
jgi:hypothetical protein